VVNGVKRFHEVKKSDPGGKVAFATRLEYTLESDVSVWATSFWGGTKLVWVSLGIEHEL